MTRCILQDGIHLGQLMVDGSNQTCRGDLEATFHFFVICIQEIAISCLLAQIRESSLGLLALCPSECLGSQSERSSAETSRGPLNSVIDQVIATPLAVGLQVRFDAIPHSGSTNLARSFTDQMGTVRVAMP